MINPALANRILLSDLGSHSENLRKLSDMQENGALRDEGLEQQDENAAAAEQVEEDVESTEVVEAAR